MLGSVRVAVVHPPLSVARDFIDYPQVSNLGAAQLAAALRDAGYATRLVDAFALPTSDLRWRADGRAHLGAPVRDVLDTLPAADATVVVTTPFHRPPHRDDLLGALLEGIPGPVVLADAYQSGQHYVEAPTLLRAYPEARAWVKYEAEATLPELLRDGVPEGVHVGRRPNLDTLPLPAWDLVDLPAYWTFHARFVKKLGRPRGAFPLGERTLPLVTSRGCPFTCIHCSSNPDRDEPKVQRRFGSQALRARVAQLAELGADTAYVLDELINVNASHFDRVLDALATHGLRFEVPNGFRADYLQERHFARMRGRVTTVSVSAESGSQRVVTQVVRKKLDLGAIRRAAALGHKAGVPVLVHFMIGLPGESAEEVNATLAFALDLWDRYRALPAVQFATPLPGTELERQARRRGAPLAVVTDWGPQFQKAPSGTGLSDEILERFMATFRLRLRESRGPRKLIMNVTYVCNNHCTFCAVGTRTQVDGHPSRQREILDKYRRHGVRLVDFDGGEPTLNPELLPLIRHARRLGYERINVTTNGRLCAYEDFARKLVTSGLTTLLFSVHGPDLKSHAREVGVAEAFDQTLAGIRHCRAHAPPSVELGMNVTLTKSNYRKLPELAALAWELGLRWLNVQFLTPFGRATKHHAPDPADAARVTQGVIDEWKDRMKIQVINLPWCFMPGYEAHVAGDASKLARHMVFVNNETVNLADYLAARRVKKPQCAPCPYACFCGGFYELEDVPEPEWLVTPQALLRRPGPELGPR